MTDIARYRTVLAVLGLLVGLLFMLSLTVGPAAIAFSDSIKALLSDKGDAIALIMREIRLPRALLGLMIGATLGLSGAALQGASAIHLNIFGPNPIVVFGNEEQKKRILPDIIKGKGQGCFGLCWAVENEGISFYEAPGWLPGLPTHLRACPL